MSDLDTLRPEVRDALMHIRPSVHRFEINSWNCVRAELLRLTDENARLLAANRDAMDHFEQMKAELTIAHHERDRMFLDAREWATRFGEMEARAEKAEAELAAARETIKRLNRRVQVAEAGIAEKVKASAPGSFGRALANAAADKYMRERDMAQAELAALKARIAESQIGMVMGGAEGNQDNTDSYRVDVPIGWESSLADRRVRLVVED